MRSRTLGFVLVLAVTSGLVSTTSAASADPVTVRLDEGVLRLHLGAQDYFRFDAASGTSPADQAITGSCPISLGSPQLVTLTGGRRTGSPGQSVNNVGLKNDGLGIKFLNCGTVDLPDWELRLKLGSVIDNGTVGDGEVAVDYAEVELEGFGGVRVIADLYRNNTFQATQQLAITGNGTNARLIVGTLNDTNDSNVLFDEIRLRPKSLFTSFSLEGGAEALSANRGPLGVSLETDDTLFRVVKQQTFDAVLECGGPALTVPGEAGVVTVSNVNVPGCEGIPVNVEVGANTVLLTKPPVDDGAVLSMTIVWAIEDAENPLPATLIDYDDAGPLPEHPMVFCNPDGGDLNTLPDVPNPATEPWCVGSQEVVPFGSPGQVQLTESYVGQGDPRFKR